MTREAEQKVEQKPQTAPTLHYVPLYKTESVQPEFIDGRLMLRYAPRGTGSSLSCGPKDEPRRIPTGIKLKVPAGYVAAVCMLEEERGKTRLSFGEMLFGDTDEVEVVYRATQHHYVNAGRVVGCVVLLELPKFTVEVVK